MGEEQTAGARIGPADVAGKKFDIVRKGYDPATVRAFLEAVRVQLESTAAREEALLLRLTEAEHRVANPELDPEVLTNALGHEMALVLRTSQEAARAVVTRAEDEASKVMDEARAEAARLTGMAESVLEERSNQADLAAKARSAEVEAEALGILADGRAQVDAFMDEARAKAATQIEEARASAAEIVEAATNEGAELLAEARQLRTRVLTDLAKRRRVLHLQVERLRAGRESLTEVVRSSRVAFAALDEGLARAEADARLAAEAAVRQVAATPEADTVAELEATLEMGRQAELVGRATGPRRLSRPAPAAAEPEPAPAEPEPAPAAEPEPAAAPAEPEPAEPAPPAAEPAPPAEPEPAEPEPAEPEPAAADAPAGPAAPAEPAPAEPAPAIAGSLQEPVEELFARLRAAGSGAPDDGTTEQDSSKGEVEERQEEVTPLAAESALQRRDQAVEALVGSLARKLKRALQDDQNAMLDQLRVRSARPRGRGGAGSTGLEGLDGDQGHLREASARYLIAAAQAGAELAGAELGGGDSGVAAETAGGEEADELAGALSGALRRRLSQILREAEGADEARTAELIGVAYREWKGERIEGLAGDHVVAAFGRGYLAAAPATATLSWIVDDGGVQCPDCDDNALAGPLVPGASYPTGQAHPPAHPGCRCLLVPT
ncbi:MAG: DivIVA domain-containing protein [Acidimicrobiales bacterium]